MKGIFHFLVTAILVMVSTKPVIASHSGFCQKKNTISYATCSTELPLLYSDDFSSFNHEYWTTDNKSVRIKGKAWMQFRHDTITSLDYVDQNLGDFRINLRFKDWRWRSPEFTIQFTTGEELVFSYQKVIIKKKKRQITRKLFAATAWPEFTEGNLPLKFNRGWNTLTIDYNSLTGVVSLDTDNDCEFDHVIEWQSGLQFSHVTASNQKWDLFELYANQAQKTEAPSSGIPAYLLEWDEVGFDTRGLAVDSGNYVYVSSSIAGSVKKYDENGNFLAEWPDFIDPRGISTDSEGFLYIADFGSNNVKKYDSNGVKISELPAFGPSYGMLSNIQDVAVDAQGTIYVSSFNMWFGPKIFKFTADWTLIGEYTLPTEAIVTGIDVDSMGNMYLATGDGIQKYDSEGNFIMNIGIMSGGSGPGEFSQGCHDIFVDSRDFVFTTDGGSNNRIQVFNTNGEYQYEWGTTGTAGGEFLDPQRTSVSSGGVYVLDSGNNRVQKFH